MALINCPECANQVSSAAPTCPKCGVPIASASESKAAGTPIQTVQETSKKFKIHTLISVALIVVGVIWSMEKQDPTIPGFVIAIGLVWLIVNRFQIWWHHK